VTGLAACGAHLIAGAVGDGPQQGHPLVAVLQVAGSAGRQHLSEDDVDFVATGADGEAERLVELVLATARRDAQPAAAAAGFVEFQLTRGLLGVST
jgi:hypothetical protein